MELWRQAAAVAAVFVLLAAALGSFRRAGSRGIARPGRPGSPISSRAWYSRLGFLPDLLSRALARLALRRGAPESHPTPCLEALSRLALTPQHSLHWIRAGDAELLVATHPQGCALLCKMPVPAPPPAPSAGGAPDP